MMPKTQAHKEQVLKNIADAIQKVRSKNVILCRGLCLGLEFMPSARFDAEGLFIGDKDQVRYELLNMLECLYKYTEYQDTEGE
ncbi:hypothetical protein ADM96_15675 [Burkholderia sp. ST111]|nr:hypothetical protein ADM96_15675 [Burkholderia sp. ST111]